MCRKQRLTYNKQTVTYFEHDQRICSFQIGSQQLFRPTQRLVEQTEIHQLQVHRFISGTLRGITSHETCDKATTWYLKYLL